MPSQLRFILQAVLVVLTLFSFVVITNNVLKINKFADQFYTAETLENADVAFFEKIEGITYDKAIKTTQVIRLPFSLENWQKGNGGLDETDRNLLGELYFNATSVFEFGLGESTRIAAKVGVPRYSGIDSDPVWVSQAREDASMDHFRFYFADIGKTKIWGYPEKKLQKSVYNYQVAALVAEGKAFDVYLVDGRYRVACVCLSFLHALKYGSTNSKVAIHDKDRYLKVLRDVVEVNSESDQLAVMQLKANVSQDDIFTFWSNYENIEE